MQVPPRACVTSHATFTASGLRCVFGSSSWKGDPWKGFDVGDEVSECLMHAVPLLLLLPITSGREAQAQAETSPRKRRGLQPPT